MSPSATGNEGAAAPLTALRVSGLMKAFGPTQALRDADFALRRGEIHAIVGENGSGKSTLVKILSGIHRPDAGSLRLGDAEIGAFDSPRAAIGAGIATVFQEVLVVEPRSVLENIWLGVDGLVRAPIPSAEKRSRAEGILVELMEAPPALDRAVEGLSLSERQSCCLARALIQEPSVLILDEATSALDVETRDRLFAVLKRRASAGTSVVFISHRMDEISEIGDRCTVMRSGETVATLERGQASTQELVRLMTGAEHLAPDSVRADHRAPARNAADVVVRARGVEIHAGELIGLAGLEGHGQDRFLQSLWQTSLSDGVPVAYVPRERRAESLFESKSIRENFGIATLSRDSRAGLLSPAATRRRLSAWVERLGIKMGRPEDLITTLSGGNQQKVVMARWLATEPRLLLLNDPTRGVDLGAKRDLYRLLTALAGDGVAIVMLSTEVDEHIELMDRVLVFREQELSVELPREQLSRGALVSAFFGSEPGA